MKIEVNQQYLIWWFTIPVFIGLGVGFSQYSLSFQLLDTYYVLANYYVVIGGAIILFVFGLCDKRIGRIPSKATTDSLLYYDLYI